MSFEYADRELVMIKELLSMVIDEAKRRKEENGAEEPRRVLRRS